MSNDERQRFVSLGRPHPDQSRAVPDLWSPLPQVSFITASTALPSGDGAKITITHVSWPPERLPLAHTCFDRLDLPEYGSKEVLREKIMWCLDNLEMAGFGES